MEEPAHSCSSAIRSALLGLLLVAGCSSPDGMQVSGTVMLNGEPHAAELVFELVASDDGAARKSVTLAVDKMGRFRAVLPSSPEVAVEYRIQVRLTSTNADGLPAAFDTNALPEKVVDLRRTLHDGQELTFAITQ